MEERLLRLIAESDNLVEIADKYIMFKYFETATAILLVGVLLVGGGYVFWKMLKDL